MRTRLPVLLALLVVAASARAETDNICGAMNARRVSFSADRMKLGFRAVLLAEPGLPPLSGGFTTDLAITLAYEPEADPANTVFTATLPAASFVNLPHGVRYKDKAGSIAGITLLTLKDGRAGTRKLSIKRLGPPIPATH